MNRNFVLAVLVGLAFFFVLAVVYKRRIAVHSPSDIITQSLIELQNPIAVKQIYVLSGSDFDISLNDNRRIRATLDVQATPEAKMKIIHFINSSRQPRAILHKENNGVWTVSLFVIVKDSDGNDVEVELSSWLKEKRLVYNL